MDVFEAIKGRRSVRKYKKQEIEKQVLEEIVDAGRWAPSAYNACAWKYVVLTDSKRIKGLVDIVGKNDLFMKDAVAVIAALSKDGKYFLEDASAGVQNMLLAAFAKGVGTCWIAGDKKDYCPQVLAYLNAPSGFRLAAIISCGYPDEKPVKNKPEVKDILVWDKF
jgi:nitroreductase